MNSYKCLLAIFVVLLAGCSGAPEQAATPTPADEVDTATAEESSVGCATIIEQAIEQATEVCDSARANQVCYGNRAINFVARDDDQPQNFSNPGDVVALPSIQQLSLSPYDDETDEWGIALMQVQARVDETLPGQNVTFLLFGDTELDIEDNPNGLQSFILRSGIGRSACVAAPDDGLLVQTPDSNVQVSFRLNNVDVQLGSTAFIQAHPSDELVFRLVEGTAQLAVDETSQTLAAGTQSRVALDESGLAASPPSDPEPYDVDRVSRLPLAPLNRQIDIAPPAPIIETIDTRGGAIFAEPITGEISVAGEADVYTFDGQAGQTLYFDGIDSPGGEVVWEILLPDESNLTDSTWANRNLGALILPESGTYTIRVFGSDAGTGAYSIQVWDIPPVEEFALTIATQADTDDGLVEDRISIPGQEKIYRFQGSAGQTLFFDGLDSPGGEVVWALLAPDATSLGDDWVNRDIGAVTLPSDGEYTLRVSSSRDGIGDYSFQVWDIPPVEEFALTIATQADTDDGLVEDRISIPGQEKIYRFQGSAGQTLFFDGLDSPGGEVVWALLAPDATSLGDDWVNRNIGAVTLPSDGEYTLRVSSSHDGIGDYSFQVWDIPPVEEFALTIATQADTDDGLVEDRISIPGQEKIYRFQGSAGQTLFFDGLDSPGGEVVWALFAPDATSLGDDWVNRDIGAVTLPNDGEYTLRVSSSRDGIGDYSFQVREGNE